MGESFALTKNSLQRLLSRPRLYAALFFAVGFVLTCFFKVPPALAERGEKLQAAEPFLMFVGSKSPQLFLLISFLLMLGDAPFFHEGMEIVAVRSSKRRWLSAQLRAALTVTLLWLLFLLAFTLLVFRGRLRFDNQWSPLMQAASRSPQGLSQLRVMSCAPCTETIIAETRPYQALGLALLVNMLLFACLYLWCAALNLWTKRSYGSALTVIFWAIHFALLLPLQADSAAVWASPMALADIHLLPITAAHVSFTVLYYLLQIVLLQILCESRLRRMDMTKLG